VPIGGRVPIFVRTSAFRLPRSPALPVVMIGPGTGLAPFRGFIQERAALACSGEVPLGAASLFFGCRAPGVDDIYADELAAALKPPPATPARSSRSAAAAASSASPPLSELHLCYSRAPGQPKRYVQAALAERAGDVWAALAAGGSLYVCGDARGMAKDVHKALLDRVLCAHGGMSAAQAETFAAALAKEGRYQRDVW
jgi:NADPH-ferrihemoprotein reductase